MFARIIARTVIQIISAALLAAPLVAAQKADSGAEAFAGLKHAKVIFDVRVPDQEKLIFNLNLINETFEGLKKMGLKPQIVIAFRGPGVKLLTVSAIDPEALELIRELKRKGVRIEVCAVATRTFQVDNLTIIPDVKLVANVFHSLIGYQNRGYAMIAIN